MRVKILVAPRDLNVRSGMIKEERVEVEVEEEEEDEGVEEEEERGKGAVPAAAGAVARVCVEEVSEGV